jgi:hypothetical protein
VVVELPLKLLVGEINAKLFERVELENLETENIEYTCETILFVFLKIVSVKERFVNLFANEVKNSFENKFSERISG